MSQITCCKLHEAPSIESKLGVALGLVPVRVLLDLLQHNVNRIDMFQISHEEAVGAASSHGRAGAASSHGPAIDDGVARPTERWNALHEALNNRDWKVAREWIEYMASSPSLAHEVASLVLWLQV